MSTESQDTLQSKAILTLLDLLGEGEIGGLVDGLKSVYLNDTPIQNADGTYNFQGVTGSWVNGTNDQTPLPNFGNYSESPFTAGVQVKKATPYTFTISSPVADAVRIIVNFPSLSYTNPDTGDISGATVQYKFSRSVDGGPFVDIGAGSEWMDGGTISAGPPAAATAMSGAEGVRATLSLNYNGGTTLVTNGLTNIPTPDSTVVQAQEFNGTSWVNLGGQKTLQAQWVSTGDYQAGGSDGDRMYTYALVTDPYTVESAYNQVRFNVVSAGSNVGVAITKVESKTAQSVVTVSGKSRSRYQRAHVLPIPRPASQVRFRVTRVTDDSTSAYLADETWVDSYAEITTLNMRYPNSALFGLRIDSQQFNQIPARSYLVDGLKIQVPTNYDPVARTYSGIWDGTFKRAVSSNPAWVLYDLLTNTRYGLGSFITSSQVDKATLYTIGRYCDEMVPDGFGGTEPRFTINTVIGSQGEAYKLISDITSVFRGMGYWDGGMVKFTQDAPSDPVMLFTPANVVDGGFNYTGSARKDRHSVVHVTWNDPEDNYKKRVEYVEDAELIAKYGVKKLDTLAFGCTSRGEAARVGRWILYTERYESDFITFKVGLDAAFAAPGDVIKIHDVARAGRRAGGRLKACTITQATLDNPITIEATPAVISMMMPDGTFIERTLTNGVGTHSVVTFSGTLTTLPVDNAVYMISEPSLEPVLARVVSVTQSNAEGTVFEITAVESNPSKYNYVETGLKLETRKTSLLDPNFVDTPTNVIVVESTYTPAPGVLASKLVLSWYGNCASYDVSWRGVSTTNASSWVRTTLSNTLTFELANVVPGVYEFSIVGINPLGVRSKTIYASYDVSGKTAPPTSVTNFSASEINGGVVLSWTGVTDVDLKSYEIRKSATIGGLWDDAAVVATVSGVTTSYSVGPVAAGTPNEWQIKAIDTSGNYSASAAVVSFIKTAASGVSVTHEYVGSNLKLSWTLSAGATAYWRVKRGTTWNTATTVASTVYDTSLLVPVDWTTGQTFWVAPVDSLGNEGEPVSVAVPFSFPSASVVDGAQQGTTLMLSWTPSTGSLPIASYEIRVGATLGASALKATTSANVYALPITWATSTTIFVVAIDANGNRGPAGSVEYVAQPPHAPVNLTVWTGLATVTLKWDAPVYPAHSYAEIFRSDTNDFASATAIGRSEVNTYADAVGSTAATKYYWVRFVNAVGLAGTFAGPVNATTGMVGGVDLSDLIVTAEKLAADAVEAGKIKDGAVTTTKIANLAVGNAAIQNAAITNAKIADLAVDDAKIANLDAAKITTGLLVADRIDSRGLSIKDAEGNVILAAGTPLNYSNVGGATRPQDNATRNVFTGNWTTGTAYVVGDIVIYNGNGWSCVTDHTASGTNQPPTSSATTSNTWWKLYTVKGDSGANAITVVLSNEAHSLPAGTDGVVSSYTGSGTTIQVFEGTTALVASSTATTSAFRIGTITQSPTSTITAGSVSYSSTTATVAQHSAMSSSADTVTLTIPITVYRADGTSSTISKVQTITKSKAGAQGVQGAQGPAVTLTASRATTFTSTDGTLDAGQADIVFTASVSGVTSPTYVWSFSGLQTNPTASTTSSQTVTAAQFGTSKSATVTCTVNGTYVDKVTIARLEATTAAAGATRNEIYQQPNAPTTLTVALSNESHAVPAAANGTVATYTGSGTTISVYEGQKALAASASLTTAAFRIGTITQSPANSITVGAVTYSGNVVTIAAHSAMSASVDKVTLTIPVTIYKTDGTVTTINEYQTITKSKVGQPGSGSDTTAYWIVSAADAIQKATGINTVTGTLTHSGQTFVAQTGVAKTYGTFTISTAGLWTYTVNSANGTVQALANGASITDTITVTLSNSTIRTIIVTITGTGVVGSYNVSANAPGTMSVVFNSATASSGTVAYSGRVVIATTTDGISFTDVYTSSVNESSLTYTIPNTVGVVALRIRAYLAGGTTTLVDEEIVPLVRDNANEVPGISYGIADGDIWVDTDTSPVVQYLRVNNAWVVASTVGASFDTTATGSITGQITSENVGTYIASAAIGNAYIADAAITNAKIADATITAAKITDATITNAKIADATIAGAKIANAAITSANIGDAQVSTLKIAGNAVTVPAGAVGTNTVTFTDAGEKTALSVTINPDGAGVIVMADIEGGLGSFGSSEVGFSYYPVYVRLRRDGVELRSIYITTPGFRQSVVFFDSASTLGSRTYTLTIQSTSSVSNSAYYSNRSLAVLGAKR